MEDISLEELDSLDDLVDMIDVTAKYDIPLDGCDSADEFKERILLHKRKLIGGNIYLDPARYEELKHENLERRGALIQIFETIHKGIEGSIPLLSQILKSRGFSDDLSCDFEDHMAALKNETVNIVIAGQTSAGKSSLLNLLLGIKILPKACLSCTSCICKLKYGTDFKVMLIKDGKVSQRLFKSQGEITEYLDDLIGEKNIDQREHGGHISEVDIYLPAVLLKSGITIVDTPGFGENEAMDNLVKDYVMRERIAGFIYVIKTDSSGGVQQDRLVRFLQTILENNKDGSRKLNPETALFVCNRWDQIEAKERSEVKASVLEKLNDVWPKLMKDQVCFFSTTRAQANLDVDSDYVVQDLADLLNAINHLIVLAQHDAVGEPYEWMKVVMSASSRYLKTILSQISMEDLAHEEKLKTIRQQMVNLQMRADDAMLKLREELDKGVDTLMNKLTEFISTKSFEEELSTWDISSISFITELSDNKEALTVKVDSMVISKMYKLLDSMDECEAFISHLRINLLNVLEDKLRTLKEDMWGIAEDFTGESINSSGSSLSSSFAEGESLAIEMKRIRESGNMTKIQKLRKRKDSTTQKRPGAFVSTAIAPLVGGVLSLFENDVKNPQQFAVRRTKKTLKALRTNKDLMRPFASRYTEVISNKLESFSSRIPSFIEEKEALMKVIVSYRREARRDRDDLKLAMECLEPQKDVLRGFGCLYIKDFASDDVLLLMDDPRIRSSAQLKMSVRLQETRTTSTENCAYGLWTVVKRAGLVIGSDKVKVTGKYYKTQPPKEHLFTEIAKLRCLVQKSIATFLGMAHRESVSLFLFEDQLLPLRQFIEKLDTTRVKRTLSGVLLGLVSGLEALHHDGLVHMELSLDTVTVNEGGEVKLSNMCLPRKVSFPPDMQTTEADDFTCLSPKVLRGAIYSRDDDVYSFGILVYELMLKKKPFEEQRSWSLPRFVREVHSSRMLQLEQEVMSEPLSDLLRGCLLPGHGLRLPLIRIKEMLQTLFDGPTQS